MWTCGLLELAALSWRESTWMPFSRLDWWMWNWSPPPMFSPGPPAKATPMPLGLLGLTSGLENRKEAKTGGSMATRKKIIIDFEYEEVLDPKTRRLIQLACAVAVGCPT
jgi:hypothetical protein